MQAAGLAAQLIPHSAKARMIRQRISQGFLTMQTNIMATRTMPNKTYLSVAAALLLGLSLAGCEGGALEGEPGGSAEQATDSAAAAPTPASPPAPPACDNCGTVASITPVERRGKGTGAGAVGGAVAGGVAGHQFGSGSGNDIATIVGALGGAYAGHKAEEKVRSTTSYAVTVRMENGGTRRIEMNDASHLNTGQKVSVYNDSIVVRN